LMATAGRCSSIGSPRARLSLMARSVRAPQKRPEIRLQSELGPALVIDRAAPCRRSPDTSIRPASGVAAPRPSGLAHHLDRLAILPPATLPACVPVLWMQASSLAARRRPLHRVAGACGQVHFDGSANYCRCMVRSGMSRCRSDGVLARHRATIPSDTQRLGTPLQRAFDTLATGSRPASGRPTRPACLRLARSSVASRCAHRLTDWRCTPNFRATSAANRLSADPQRAAATLLTPKNLVARPRNAPWALLQQTLVSLSLYYVISNKGMVPAAALSQVQQRAGQLPRGHSRRKLPLARWKSIVCLVLDTHT
jgi:hypothetical protein